MRTLNVTVADDTAARLAERAVDDARLGKALDRLFAQNHGSQSIFGAVNETIAEETLQSLPEVMQVETLNEMKDLGDFLVVLWEAPTANLVVENKTGTHHRRKNHARGVVITYLCKSRGEGPEKLYTADALSVVTVPAFYEGEWHLLSALASELPRNRNHPTKIKQTHNIPVAELGEPGCPWSNDLLETLRRAAFEKALKEAFEMQQSVVMLDS